MRQIVLDTETTGLSVSEGHRLIEVGCLEMLNRRLTGKRFHYYVNPQRDVEEGAMLVHGITTEFLQDKPLFAEIAAELVEFVRGAELIIHNAPFDVGFLDAELAMVDVALGKIGDHCKVTDTLAMARNMYPGQRNTLDALCKRFEIDNSRRDLHGALIDADLLAQVYLYMTGGQTGLELGGALDASGHAVAEPVQQAKHHDLPVLRASEEEAREHADYLQYLDKSSKGKCLWLKLEQTG